MTNPAYKFSITFCNYCLLPTVLEKMKEEGREEEEEKEKKKEKSSICRIIV